MNSEDRKRIEALEARVLAVETAIVNRDALNQDDDWEHDREELRKHFEEQDRLRREREERMVEVPMKDREMVAAGLREIAREHGFQHDQAILDNLRSQNYQAAQRQRLAEGSV